MLFVDRRAGKWLMLLLFYAELADVCTRIIFRTQNLESAQYECNYYVKRGFCCFVV